MIQDDYDELKAFVREVELAARETERRLWTLLTTLRQVGVTEEQIEAATVKVEAAIAVCNCEAIIGAMGADASGRIAGHEGDCVATNELHP